jgi:3-oxoacyl-[acyl-carrier protein] reductase
MTKKFLITGASGGIGSAMAKALASPNHELCLHYRNNESSIQSLKKELEGQVGKISTLQFDVANASQTQERMKEHLEKEGPFYGVIYNCGITRDSMFPNLSSEDWSTVLRTNLEGFYHVVQPTIMPMIRAAKGGRIVVVSSVSGVIGNSGQTNYSASKAGLIGAAKALAVEVAKRNITVNVIAPGLIETEMTAELDQKLFSKSIPLRRFGKASEVGSLTNFLCSDEAAYITRQVININGGMF